MYCTRTKKRPICAFTAGGGAAFIAKFAEDDGYSVTKGAEGMIDFKIFCSVEAPDTVIIWCVSRC